MNTFIRVLTKLFVVFIFVFTCGYIVGVLTTGHFDITLWTQNNRNTVAGSCSILTIVGFLIVVLDADY